LISDFINVPSGQQAKQMELIAELEEVVRHFRRLRPAPTFKREPHLRIATASASSVCSIYLQPVDLASEESFETPGAVYHLSCYSGAPGI